MFRSSGEHGASASLTFGECHKENEKQECSFGGRKLDNLGEETTTQN